MLQRAATNAYSWWWASHIRTKQSKWLEQNLQDMEEKIKSMLKLIEEDADSFAKKAEMYYRKRPELINLVEESYRSYRALAERYDHISGELHNANHAIATVFPDQVQLSMADEDGDDSPEPSSSLNPSKFYDEVPENQQFGISNEDIKNPLTPEQMEARRPSSQMSKDEAKREIDKIQKGILALQTQKEFIKSSNESGLAKYLEIEKQITEMQEEVICLQDEFNVDAVIEDEEARFLMTATALKSCEKTLVKLQEQQNRSTEEAILESERVTEASKNWEEKVCSLKKERREFQSICKEVKGHLEMNPDSILAVSDLTEKINKLVNKVIGFETAVSSQNGRIQRLRLETDEFNIRLNSLEDDKMDHTDGSKNLGRIGELEDELHRIQDLNQSVQDENNKLLSHFAEACRNLNDLYEKLQSHKQQDEIEIVGSSQEEERSRNMELHGQCKQQEHIMMTPTDDLASSKAKIEELEEEPNGIRDSDLGVKDEEHFQSKDYCNLDDYSEKLPEPKQKNEVNTELQKQNVEQEDLLSWQQLLLNGLGDREKILLAEYTSILRNYKETKRRLSEVEKKNQDTLFEMMAEMRELKSANAKKDEEIWSLKRQISFLQTSFDENSDSHLIKFNNSQHSKPDHTLDESNSCFSDFHTEISNQVIPELIEERTVESTEHTNKSGIPSIKEQNKVVLVDESHTASTIKEKFRRDIDVLLKENLEFWLRFTSSFRQIRKFQTKIQDLQAEYVKFKDESKMQEGSNTAEQVVKPEAGKINKDLRELQAKLSVWLEQNALLKEELQCRLSSLSKIREEISRNSETKEADAHQAAKFEGEVLNMQQENKKVADELQAGLDHVRDLQSEVTKILSELHDGFKLLGSKNLRHHMKHSMSRARIPLRNFIFGVKHRKPSIFSCMNPVLQKQYSDLSARVTI